MDKQHFMNKEIINKNNEKGIVVSFDDTYIVIKYQNEEKTYNPNIAFKNGFLSFIDKDLNNLLMEDVKNEEDKKIKEEELAVNNRKKTVARIKKLREVYWDLSFKNRRLKKLFGSDFVYPPLVEFIKKHKKYFVDIKKERKYVRCYYW